MFKLKEIFVCLFIPYLFPAKKIVFWHGLARKAHLAGFLRVSLFIECMILARFGCAISPLAKIGKGFSMGHAQGVVIGAGVEIKDNVTIYQNTTIGRSRKDKPGGPVIGFGTVVYANSVIVGDIEIGDNVVIGACSFIDRSIPSNTVVARTVRGDSLADNNTGLNR